jgi:DNA-binding NtrC family response regulator
MDKPATGRPANVEHTVLLVDDEPAVLDMLACLLSDQFPVLTAGSGTAAVDAVQQDGGIAAVVMDIKMAGMDGLAAAREIRKIAPDVPIIFHTGYPGDYNEDEIDATEKPFDYVLKGEAISRIIRAVRNAVECYRLKRGGGFPADGTGAMGGIIGRSQPMQHVFGLIRRAAPTDSRIMILGETGTGKELVARSLHAQSPRKEHRLAILNCNHKSPDLVETELFGHVAGAFTGAVGNRLGLFEYADKGTVFLDEIGDLDMTTQAKILRVLETGEFQRIGAPENLRTDVRIICATHRNLADLVARQVFREDLFYRLKGITVELPPLRDRREDIPLLVERFLDRCTVEQGLSPKIFDSTAMDELIAFDWPGNVRQLLNTVESLVTLAESDIIFGDDVKRFLNLDQRPDTLTCGNLTERVRSYEKTLIIAALQQTGYNISAAARVLLIDRTNLRNKIALHGISLPSLHGE